MNIPKTIVLAGASALTSVSTAIVLLTGYFAIVNPSVISFLGLGAALLLWIPVKKIFDDIKYPLESLEDFYISKKTKLTLTALIFSLTSVSFLTGISIPVLDLLNFSFFASTRLFQQLQYLGRPLTFVGVFLYEFSRFYFHLFLVYSLTDAAVTLIQKFEPELKGDELQASMIPFTGEEAEIEIYVVTGIHGFFRIPDSYCKECNLFYQAAKKVADESEKDVEIQVRSYWTRFLRPLMKGGFHPPVILVNGRLVSQGYEVPDPEEIISNLKI